MVSLLRLSAVLALGTIVNPTGTSRHDEDAGHTLPKKLLSMVERVESTVSDTSVSDYRDGC